VTHDLRGLVSGIASTEVVTRDDLPHEPLTDDEWARLVALVRIQRLEPQLSSAVVSGALGATSPQRSEAERLHASAMARCLLLDRSLLHVADRLDEVDIPFVVLKGPAVAHLDHPDPARRSYGDLDLLIAPTHLEATGELLGAIGGTRAYMEPRAGYDRRFGKGMAFRIGGDLEIDVHRTLTLGPFGLAIDLDQLDAHHDTLVIGRRRLRALDRPRRFLHACYHAVLGRADVRFVPLLDVVRCAPASESELQVVISLSKAWRADVVVETAVEAAVARLGWLPSASMVAALDELRPTAQQRRWLDAYRGPRRSSARLTLSGVTAIDGWRDRVDYLRAILWPSNRGGGDAVRRLARGARALTDRR
jgi:hypothetical protein